MKKLKKNFAISISFFVAFILYTCAIQAIDLQAIGPKNSAVGFAEVNGWFHSLTGTNMMLYTITDWLGLVPVAFAFAFAVLGLVQLIKRKSLLKVDKDIMALGFFYILVIAVYILFEYYVVNRRPILINEFLEASYPSSTTMLVMCVMPTAMMQIKKRIKNKTVKNLLLGALFIFSVFMVIGRLVSGVHWLTDIIGGALISTALVMLYYSVECVLYKNNKQ